MLMPSNIPFTKHFPFEPQAVARGMAWGVSAGWCNCSSTLWPCSCPGHRPGLDYCRTPRTAQGPALLYHSPVYSTAVLRDSQRKTTMCSSRLSPKVLWSQKKDIIDYSCLWIKPKHRKQNWYLSKPRRLVFFPAFDWFCHSLVIPYYLLLHKA